MDEDRGTMEGFAMDDFSFSEFVDSEFEFDACQFYDFSVDETDYEVREAERWFIYAREYPPAPYMVKINLMNVTKSIPVKVQTSSSPKVEADEHVSPSFAPSNHGVPSSKVKTEAGSGLKCHNFIAHNILNAKLKSTTKLSKSSSPTFMKPTASHLAKQNKALDVHAGGCGRLYKLQTLTGCEIEDIKRQKLEIGYLRKVAQLKHRTSLSHKMATKAAHLEASSNSQSKTTIPQKPELMTEERARMRRSQSKSEVNTHTFKALPLNRNILESPSLPMRKKRMPDHSPEFQKFHFKTTVQAMQHQSANVLNTHTSTSSMQSEVVAFKRQNPVNAVKDRCGSPNKFKACVTDKAYPNKDGDNVSIARHRHNLLPIDFFMKLSLKSDHSETKRIYPVNPRRASKASSQEKAHA